MKFLILRPHSKDFSAESLQPLKWSQNMYLHGKLLIFGQQGKKSHEAKLAQRSLKAQAYMHLHIHILYAWCIVLTKAFSGSQLGLKRWGLEDWVPLERGSHLLFEGLPARRHSWLTGQLCKRSHPIPLPTFQRPLREKNRVMISYMGTCCVWS